MNANNNQKVRLSIEEFLSMNDKWLERQAQVKKKKEGRTIKFTIYMLLIAIGGPVLLIPMLSDYFGFGAVMIFNLVVLVGLFLVVYKRFESQQRADEDESEKIKKELYSQYLKENGFI